MTLRLAVGLSEILAILGELPDSMNLLQIPLKINVILGKFGDILDCQRKKRFVNVSQKV